MPRSALGSAHRRERPFRSPHAHPDRNCRQSANRFTDYARSKQFFTQALAPLGIQLVMEVQGWAGFGRDGKPEFWFGTYSVPQSPLHIAFAAQNREQVRAFYQAALAAGGQDNGPPGIREIYHPSYYGAFVIGPDGHNIEAVCHTPDA